MGRKGILAAIVAGAMAAVAALQAEARSFVDSTKKSLKNNWPSMAGASAVVLAAALGWLDPSLAFAVPFMFPAVVKTAAGTVISISSNIPTAFTQAGYENSNVIFTAIGEITDGGTHGRKYNEITHSPLASRGLQKFKGSFNEGTKTLQMGLDSDDAGQIILVQALNSDNNYSFKVAYPGGDIDYFQAKVMSYDKGTANADSIVTASVELALQTSSGGIGIVEYLAP